jgi:hypothetical protein
VLEAFVGPRPQGAQCRHLDGDAKNNRAENLRWGTQAENEADKRRHGTYYTGPRGGLLRGGANPAAKLTESSVRTLRRLHRTGLYKQEVLGRAYGVEQTVISNVVRRKTWAHVP